MSQACVMQEVLEQQGEMLSPSLASGEVQDVFCALCQEKARCPGWQSWAGLWLQPRQCCWERGRGAAVPEEELSEPTPGCSWCWEPLPPAASGQNGTSESEKGGNRLWAAPGAVGPFAAGGVGSAQVEGTRLLHRFGWKTQSRHR